jgi:hypothetical protein
MYAIGILWAHTNHHTTKVFGKDYVQLLTDKKVDPTSQWKLNTIACYFAQLPLEHKDV